MPKLGLRQVRRRWLARVSGEGEMPWDGARYRIGGPDEARQLGLDHGRQSSSVIDRVAVVGHFPRWTAAEIDAYLDGRRKGIEEVLSCPS